MKKHLLFLIVCCTSVVKLMAQADPHFSQYYAYPLFLNPALTGVSEGDYRATAIYRNQWSAVGKPFTTSGISGDLTTNSNLSFGLNILNQTAGGGGYQYITGSFSIAFSGIKFDADGYQTLSLGLQGGIINRRYDPNKLQFGDQWVPYVGFNPSVASADVFTRRASTHFDAGAGLVYYDANPDKSVNIFGGFSANHLTRPEDPFLDATKQTMPIRYIIHGGARLRISDNSTLVPNFIFMQQGEATEKMLGGYIKTAADDNTDLMLGANMRFGESIVPFVGISFSKMTFGISYDVNTTDLTKGSGKANSIELSFTINGSRPGGREYFKCPVF
jgi:type IX secretion system PorP/SprF family membrane protein